jgi:hypothetical protein
MHGFFVSSAIAWKAYLLFDAFLTFALSFLSSQSEKTLLFFLVIVRHACSVNVQRCNVKKPHGT